VSTVIADSGALYALVDRSDSWHKRVVAWWQESRDRVLVPITTLPEVSWLLQARLGSRAEERFISSVSDGEFELDFLEDADVRRAAQLVTKYRDIPLGFVYATIVALAERHETREILTTDRRHFGVVQPSHARRYNLLP
jgi:predicted nucleic acid-binding protein